MILPNGNHVRLMTAIENNEVEAALEILTADDDDSLLLPIQPLRVTALQLAAWQENIELMDKLYERGADVNARDKIGRCALYYAAHRGNIEVVKWLLQRGAFIENTVCIDSCSKDSANSPVLRAFLGKSLPLPECWGRTPLHQAVKNNHPEVVRILVNVGANVNVQDERGIVPLLIAGSSVDPQDPIEMSKFVETIDILVSAKASANVIHPDTGTTALHHAAALGSSKAVQRLLEGNARPSQQCTKTGSSPLHVASSAGHFETIQTLLAVMRTGDIDIQDQLGQTALHRASYQGHRRCVRTLIDHGANLAAETKTGVTVIGSIFTHMPRPLPFLTDILDSRVRTTSDVAIDKDTCIKIDFGVLTPKNKLQMEVVMAVVSAASELAQLTILQHPFMETFLRLKWSRLRIFFFVLVLIHALFVLSLSSYSIVLLRYSVDCSLWRRILTFSSCLVLVNNVAEVVMMPRHYLKEFETWLSFTCATVSLVISVAGDYAQEIVIRPREGILNGPQHPSQWVLHSISVAILLGWLQMMLLIGRFPMWGYYALMFSTVLKNVLKVLLAFVCLIVGFALSFAVLFHGNDQFRDSWRAVVKTVVMMMGEYEYEDLFSSERNESSFLPATSRVVFLAFVMLASIVLMNLMIGLAVNDIQGLEKEGHIRRLLKQAEFVAHLERVMSHGIFRSNWLHPRLRVLLDARRIIPTKITFYCRENYFHESYRGIPATLIEALFLLASKNARDSESSTVNAKCNEKDVDLYATLYSLEQQLQQLQKLGYSNIPGQRYVKPLVKRHAVRRRKTTNV
ncbi:hypothetical protein KM043_002750 [Ampulex compressa]|nr:hypothetical protein KM043_002750 [Ampulex compressa]